MVLQVNLKSHARCAGFIAGLMDPSKTQQMLQMFVLLVLSRTVNPRGCLRPQGHRAGASQGCDSMSSSCRSLGLR